MGTEFCATTDAELRLDIEAYIASGGNRSAAAKARGVPRQSYNDRLKLAEKRFDMVLGRVVDCRIEAPEIIRRSLPGHGRVARYILTAVQNNTYSHPGFINLVGYANYLDKFEGGSCELIVGTFSYAIDAYGAKTAKRSAWRPTRGPWYAPEFDEFRCDDRIELAPGLMWCGEMNILPTVSRPLSGLETFGGRSSCIFPHAKQTMESVAALPGEGTKFMYTTGAATLRNYVQRKLGIMAEELHAFGGLLVEVDHGGTWFVRQLTIDGNGHVYDIGPSGRGPVVISDGEVGTTLDAVDSIVWADLHAAQANKDMVSLATRSGGMLDVLGPRRQFFHDVFSMRARNPHNEGDFHTAYKQHVEGTDIVEDEVIATAQTLNLFEREWCQAYIVASNHDRHLNRWLNETDPRKDVKNAEYHVKLQAAALNAIRESPSRVLQFALCEAGLSSDFLFLGEDESYVICRDVDGGIECGMHGDRGAGGSRGSTAGLAKLARAIIKGHDHKATIHDKVFSVGCFAETADYCSGPSAWSVSHVVVFKNGRRQILTMFRNKWRA